MKRNDYLRFSIDRRCYEKRAWVISLLAVTVETEAQKAEKYPGKLVREPFGYFVVLDTLDLEAIEDAKDTKSPLFTIKTPITITPDWLSSVPVPSLDTTVGRLLLNAIALHSVFGNRFPYMNTSFIPDDIEAILAPKLENTPPPGVERDPAKYYVDERLKFCEAVGYLEMFSQVVAHSITSIGLMPAPGRKAFKAELLKKYDGQLTDPVMMSKFERELNDFDDAYLKADPAYGKFMSGGKVKGSRMKLYMTQGGETNSFSQALDVVPIIPALEDGIPLDREGFTAISNTIRYGSYSRGAETINGGVTAKGMMAAADNWRIVDGDCGSTLGTSLVYYGKDAIQLVGRYVIEKGKPVLIETPEAAMAYDTRRISVRSPQYCRKPGTQTCEVCAGKALSKYKTGLPIPLMEVSGGILTDSLKKMHNTGLSTVSVNLNTAIS